ncbi:hypothetical protein ACRQU7_01515 [Caproiciproducens sp. R1]|uniref:hypothetical protein n=1 Tax=Acutalibacteraceae TaxID=3082771 RepID=UPI002E111851
MKKKAISLIMMLVLLITSGVPAFAYETKTKNSADSGFNILLLNVDDAIAYLNFSGTRADCAAIVDGKSGTSKITATAYLKRVEGNTKTVVKSWTGLSTTDESFYFDQPYYVASGYTYEFELDAAVTRNGVTEYISISDTDYCG